MGFELERVLEETEDFLRRHVVRSRTAREASKRRAQRRMQEFGRRFRRAVLIFAGLLAGLAALSIFVDVGLLAILLAIPAALAFSLVSLAWPTAEGRRAAAPVPPGTAQQTLPLEELARRAEEAMMDRSTELPARALPAADAIVDRLGHLQPCLAALDPNSLLAGDARRLIGQHLPRLVDAYLELPAPDRAPASEPSQRLIESLDIVADELGDLLTQASREKHLSFETQRRFIETRYKDDDRLSGE